MLEYGENRVVEEEFEPKIETSLKFQKELAAP